jgi:hypothetical protein
VTGVEGTVAFTVILGVVFSTGESSDFAGVAILSQFCELRANSTSCQVTLYPSLGASPKPHVLKFYLRSSAVQIGWKWRQLQDCKAMQINNHINVDYWQHLTHLLYAEIVDSCGSSGSLNPPMGHGRRSSCSLAASAFPCEAGRELVMVSTLGACHIQRPPVVLQNDQRTLTALCSSRNSCYDEDASLPWKQACLEWNSGFTCWRHTYLYHCSFINNFYLHLKWMIIKCM